MPTTHLPHILKDFLAIETATKLEHAGIEHVRRSYLHLASKAQTRPRKRDTGKYGNSGPTELLVRERVLTLLGKDIQSICEQPNEVYGSLDNPRSLDDVSSHYALGSLLRWLSSSTSLPAWKIAPAEIKVACAHAALIRHGGYRCFTAHIDRSLVEHARNEGKNLIDLVAERLRTNIKDSKSLNGVKLNYWFVIEISTEREKNCSQNSEHYHLHGGVSLPPGIKLLDAEAELRRILRLSCGRGYHEAANHHQVKLSYPSDFLPGMGMQRPSIGGTRGGELGWADYCVKDCANTTTRLGSRPIVITTPLIKAAKRVYGQHRQAQITAKTHAETLDGLLALFRWAAINIRNCRYASTLHALEEEQDTLDPALHETSKDLERKAKQHSIMPISQADLLREVVAIVSLPEMQDIRPRIRQQKDLLKLASADWCRSRAARVGDALLRYEMRDLRDLRKRRKISKKDAERQYQRFLTA